MLKGYMGQVLDIDVGTREHKVYPPNAKDLRLYVGGKGIGSRILYDETPAMIDPLGPENILVFATGPLNGSVVAQSNRFTVTAKSPLTGGIGNSACGGRFASTMKKAGYDIIIIRGVSKTPIWIEIDEDKITYHDAKNLWGKGTYETQELLPAKAGKAVIGPAGENLVRFAAIASDDRMAGRTGLGAVMGSKKIKAITTTGKKKMDIANESSLQKYNKWLGKYFKNHPQMGDILPSFGTSNIVLSAFGTNTLPTHNFKYGNFAKAMNISGEKMAADFLHKNGGCIHCPIHCGREVSKSKVMGPAKSKKIVAAKTIEHKAASGKAEGDKKEKVETVKGPEYESVALLGSNLEVDNLEKIINFAYMCDDLGMDTISTGSVLAFTMELNERKMLKGKDVPKIGFGAVTPQAIKSIETAITNIALRKGFGKEMAEGTKRMAEKFGGMEFSMQVKGLDLPGYDPRGNFAQALEYATTNRGGCHIQGASMYLETIGPLKINPRSTIGKPDLAIMQQNMMAALSSMVLCHFTSYAIIPSVMFKIDPHGWLMKTIAKVVQYSGPVLRLITRMHLKTFPLIWFEKWMTYVTGRKMSLGHVQELGDRVFNLERMYNIREGFTYQDDTLPERALNEPLYKDTNRGVPLEKMLPQYYKIRGWDKNGVPKDSTLKKLKIRR